MRNQFSKNEKKSLAKVLGVKTNRLRQVNPITSLSGLVIRYGTSGRAFVRRDRNGNIIGYFEKPGGRVSSSFCEPTFESAVKEIRRLDW
jgi:hypothetical protein